MGCLRKVFRAEIDVDMFELAEAAGGFGGIKMTGEPLPQCQFRVEPAYEGDGAAYSLRQPALLRLHRRGPRGHPRLRPARLASRVALNNSRHVLVDAMARVVGFGR